MAALHSWRVLENRPTMGSRLESLIICRCLILMANLVNRPGIVGEPGIPLHARKLHSQGPVIMLVPDSA